MNSSWTETTLGEGIEFTNGVSYVSEDYAIDQNGHFFLTIKCFEKGGGFSWEGVKYIKGFYLASQVVEPGDLLLANTDLTRAGDIIGSPMIVPDLGEKRLILPSMDVSVLRTSDKKTNLVFLYYRLMQPDARHYMLAHSAGSTVLHLETKSLPKYKFNRPSPIEQLRICDILSTIDKEITLTESLIAKHQQIKAGMMQDLFTRGITEDGKLRPTYHEAPHLYKESRLGWIPKEWEVVLLRDLFDCQLGKMLNKLAKTGKMSAKYLGNKAVQWDYVDINELEEMDFDPQERLKFSLLPGDLLVCEGGDVGRTVLWRGEIEDCYYQKAIHRLRRKEENIYPEFILRFMRFAYSNGLFNDFTSQSSIAHLTMEKLKMVNVLMPSIEEQTRISVRLNSIDSMLQIELQRLIKTKYSKLGLMHDLLTGKVPVIIH